MSVGIPSANPVYSLQSVLAAQIALFTAINQESSGTRIMSAAVEPSGLAIFNNVSTQSQGADTANQNVSDASNAVNVAQGATSTISSSLSQINSLAIEANNGFNSASDNQALQDAATQLAQGINQIAGGTNFNGTQLLDGTNAGNTPATPATAVATNNNAVGSGGNVLASVSPSGATTSGTFAVSVDGSGKADVSFTDSTTQATTVVGSFAAGSSTSFNGTTLNFGNFTASDSGTSATVQTTAATAGSTAPTVSVQSGPNEGDTTNVSFGNATTTGLGITNIDLSNPSSATNTEGQINGALTAIGNNQATLGAQSNSLDVAFQNNNTLSNNLTASASAIGDTNEAKSATTANSASILQQISLAVLARANTDAGHLNSFLSQYA